MTLGPLAILLRAANFAAVKHSTQRRKDAAATPSINHPLAVAEMLATLGSVTDSEILAAALLHDTLEDTETAVQELTATFSPRVAALVQEVSDDKSLPSTERKRLQIEKSSSSSVDAKLIKMADKICNLRDLAASPPPDWDLERCQGYFDWAQQGVDGLRGISAPLEAAFDAAWLLRPVSSTHSVSEPLRRAYEKSDYLIADYPHKFSLLIGQPCQPVWALLWDYSLASAIFITACNPLSQIRSEAENIAGNRHLAQRLDELNAVAVLSGLVSDPQGVWPDEPSFLALGLSLEAGQVLVKEFEQNAFVFIAAGQAPQLVYRTQS